MCTLLQYYNWSNELFNMMQLQLLSSIIIMVSVRKKKCVNQCQHALQKCSAFLEHYKQYLMQSKLWFIILCSDCSVQLKAISYCSIRVSWSSMTHLFEILKKAWNHAHLSSIKFGAFSYDIIFVFNFVQVHFAPFCLPIIPERNLHNSICKLLKAVLIM